MSDEKNIRAFLAIEPPESVLQAVVRLQEKLKREISGRLSWTRPQGQHLTLKFFGDVSINDIQRIRNAVENRSAATRSLSLKIEKLGVFPDFRKPRVLWCGTSGDISELAALQKQMGEDFAAIGFPVENRPFRAHLTLARIKDSRSLTGLDEILKKHAAFDAGTFPCRELILFQSKLAPQGAIYTKLAEFTLN